MDGITSLRFNNSTNFPETVTLPPELKHLVVQGRRADAHKAANKPAGGGDDNALPRPGLVHKLADLAHFITDTPNLHERLSDDECKPGLDVLVPAMKTPLHTLELLAFVDCRFTSASADELIDALSRTTKRATPLTVVLLGVDAFNLQPEAAQRRERLLTCLQPSGAHVIDDYAGDLHRAASSMYPDAKETYKALWCPPNLDLCRIAMRGDTDAYKRYTSQACVPVSAHLTPYQIAQLGQHRYTPWRVSSTVLAGALAYVGAKAILRSLTQWMFPSLRLPKFALLCTGAAVAYSTGGHKILADALGLAAGTNLGWGLLMNTAVKALLGAGHVATGALLLMGITLGRANNQDARLGEDEEDSDDKEADGARAGFKALRATVLKLMKRGAYKHIRDPDTIRKVLNVSVVKKRLRRPHVLLSMVVWVLKVCMLMGVGYGVYRVAQNETVKEGTKSATGYLTDRAQKAYSYLNKRITYRERVVHTMYASVWKALGFRSPSMHEEDEEHGAEAASFSPYLPPLRSKTDMLHPTHVCLDLVGRELWVVDQSRHKALRTLCLKKDAASKEKDRPYDVYYASVQVHDDKKEHTPVPLTCTKEMYEHCARVYKDPERLPMKRVRVTKYQPHVSALETRVSMLVNLFVSGIASAIERFTLKRKGRTPSGITYDTLHTQFKRPLLNKFQQVLKMMCPTGATNDTMPSRVYNVLAGFEEWETLQLPTRVVQLLQTLTKQAKRYPTLCAGLLLLLLLSCTGVLPILLLVVSASLLATGDTLLTLLPQMGHYLDAKQWKTTLRSLVRTMYVGNTRVFVKASETPEQAGGGWLEQGLSSVHAGARKLKQEVKGAFANRFTPDESVDLAVDPTMMYVPPSVKGPSQSNDAQGYCVYLRERLERQRDQQTVDEYMNPGVPEARVLVPGLYYVAADQKLYAFASGEGKYAGEFRYLVHLYDLCKFTADPAKVIERCDSSTFQRKDIQSYDHVVLLCDTAVFCFRRKTTGAASDEGDTTPAVKSLSRVGIDIHGKHHTLHCTTKEMEEMSDASTLQAFRLSDKGTLETVDSKMNVKTWYFVQKDRDAPWTLAEFKGGVYKEGHTKLHVKPDTDKQIEATQGKDNTCAYSKDKTIWQVSRLPLSEPVPDTVNHLIVGTYRDRFGRGQDDSNDGNDDSNDDTKRWTDWLQTFLVERAAANKPIKSLVLNIPLDFGGLAQLDTCTVHVRFLDTQKLKDPWRGFCGCAATVKACVIHYVPALTLETSETYDDDKRMPIDEKIDFNQAVCVSMEYAQERARMNTDERDALVSDDGGTYAYNWLTRALSQSNDFGATFIRAPLHLFPSKMKDMDSDVQGLLRTGRPQLPPPQAVTPLIHPSAYFTVKRLQIPALTKRLLDKDNLKHTALRTLLEKDVKVSYMSHVPHVVVHDDTPWLYSPGRLYVTDAKGKTMERYRVHEDKTVPSPPLLELPTSSTSSSWTNIEGRPEEFRFTFIRKDPPPKTAYLVWFDAPSYRLYELKKGEKDEQDEYTVAPATGIANITDPIHLLLRTLVRCTLENNWLAPMLASTSETCRVICFELDNRKKLQLLELSDTLQKRPVFDRMPLFQRIIHALKTMVTFLSDKLKVSMTMTSKRLDGFMRKQVFLTVVPKGVQAVVKSFEKGKASVASLLSMIRERFKKALSALTDRFNATLRRKRVPLTDAAHRSGGTRKRPIHRPVHPYRHRTPASTQRRRLAKRTQRRRALVPRSARST